MPSGTLTIISPTGGRRLLRRWMCRPLRSIPDIEARLDAVEALCSRPGLSGSLRTGMKAVGDLERCLGRVRNAAQAPSAGLPQWALEQAQRRCARIKRAGAAAKERPFNRHLQ